MPALLGERTRSEVWSGSVIDVDVHAVVPSIDVLLPYLNDFWRQHIRERAWTGPTDTSYPPGVAAAARSEWRPEGRVPASDVSLLREHILDPWDVECAILNCYYPVNMGHPDAAAALASAVNDWLIAEWLDVDPRLRASMVVAAHEPQAIIKEIQRVGDHPGFVQVLMPVRSGRPYGRRMYHPVYQEMERHDLVMGLHWGGTNEGDTPSTTGWPSWYAEEYAAEVQLFESQITNLIAEGVFQAAPSLRVSVLEIGFLWLPSWGWRMDKEWKGMRREIPWVTEPPLSIIRDHMRFSVAPLDAGPPEELARTIGWLKSEELLMFATDYPHVHDDDLGQLLQAMPSTMRPRLMSENAREWYRL
jgi:uncharacterized protein